MTSNLYLSAHYRICILLTVVAYTFSLSSLHAAYRPPDMEKELFASSEIELDKFSKAGLVGALVSVSRDFDDVSYETRAYALAIAGRLDNDSVKVAGCLKQLRETGKTISVANADQHRSADRLYSGIRSLMRKKNNDANQRCAAFCMDIAIAFEPSKSRVERLNKYKNTLSNDGFTADWTGILKAAIHNFDNNRLPSTANYSLAGSSDKKLPLLKSRINGLYNPYSIAFINQEISSTPIILTAVKDETQKGIVFQFQHPVGNAILHSLDSTLKFLNKIYKESEIPSGYIVIISMNHRTTPIDSLRYGIPLALAINSLITGEENHDQYAGIGRINQRGESIPTKQNLRILLSAINQKCELMSITDRDSKFVYDFFLLQGIESLLKINIFSHKNFDEAKRLSLKKRDTDLQEAISLYAELGQLTRKIGPEFIKDNKAKSILNKILEKTPNHLCARVLLDYSEGKIGAKFSLLASIEEIDHSNGIYTLVNHRHSRTFAMRFIQHIREIENFIDPRIMNYCNQSLSLQAQIAKGPHNGESDTAYKNRIEIFHNKAIIEREKIFENQKLQPELKR